RQELSLNEGLVAKLEDLENESLRLTNNNEQAIKNAKISGYSPSGTVTVWDQTLNRFLPIEGATIRAKRWFTTRTGTTNNVGFYSINHSFNGSVDYDIIWETSNFDIRSGNYGQATTGQNNINGTWSPQIMPTSGIGSNQGILSNSSFG